MKTVALHPILTDGALQLADPAGRVEAPPVRVCVKTASTRSIIFAPDPKKSFGGADKRCVTNSAEAVFTLLSSTAPEPAAARVVSISGVELTVVVPFDVVRGAAAKIEIGDMLLLGEVICVEQREDGYCAKINVQHALNSLSDLMRLNRSILGHEDRSVKSDDRVQSVR